MKRYLAIIAIFISVGANAQVGVTGGASFLKGFGVDGLYKGLHLGVEVPRDDMVSFYGRMIVTLPNYYTDTMQAAAINPATTFPSQVFASTKFGSSYMNLQAGTRYYLGNGYDYGFSAYGGSIFELTTMGVTRHNQESIDESKYVFVDSHGEPVSDTRGRVLGFSLGLNAGVKYNLPFGLFYFDITGSYLVFGFSSNQLAASYNSMAPLSFGFNFGFKKEIY